MPHIIPIRRLRQHISYCAVSTRYVGSVEICLIEPKVIAEKFQAVEYISFQAVGYISFQAVEYINTSSVADNPSV